MINTVKIKMIVQHSPEELLVQYHQKELLSWGLSMILAEDILAWECLELLRE